MKYQAVIFDLDGVLVHTDRYHYLAWKTIADELGVTFDEKINNRLRGVSRMACLEIVLETYDEPLTDEQKAYYAERKNQRYKQLLEELSTQDLSDEIRHTMVSLREHGVKLAIGSSSKNAKLILQRIGLDDFFDAVSDGTNIVHSKPHPEVFLKASDYLGILPQQCLVIEDAMAGVEAALAANMDCAVMGDALGHPQATYRLNHFPDLLHIVLGQDEKRKA
ncbi:MAG: beta-phosphoglucomutase [Syntrophomonadaceae bacterium]|jgi:beta-phosphoglucomutase|nr:beta-phosphoglucomutase [Bacillota bacterium]NLP23885.1 beta-phosphoglucomutase [Syntrophomonadaceae bacterium]